MNKSIGIIVLLFLIITPCLEAFILVDGVYDGKMTITEIQLENGKNQKTNIGILSFHSVLDISRRYPKYIYTLRIDFYDQVVFFKLENGVYQLIRSEYLFEKDGKLKGDWEISSEMIENLLQHGDKYKLSSQLLFDQKGGSQKLCIHASIRQILDSSTRHPQEIYVIGYQQPGNKFITLFLQEGKYAVLGSD